MKRAKNLLLSMAAVGVLAVPTAFATQDEKGKPITVTINRVAQVDNLDKGDQLGRDDADFYVQIWINGQTWRSQNMSKDDGEPENWTFTAPVNGNTANIRIRVWDDDGGLEDNDDHVDVSPLKGKKDLNLHVDMATGAIKGDVDGDGGNLNTMLHAGGLGDDDKAQIWFTVK